MTSFVFPVLGGIATVLAATIAIEISGAGHQTENLKALASTARHDTAWSADLDGTESWPRWIEISLARPLFEPDRRPPAAAAGVVSNDMPRLTGIIITPTARSAIFVAAAGGRAIVVMQGARINDFVVRSIDEDKVTLVTSTGIRIVRPSFAMSKASSDGETGLQPLTLAPAVSAYAPSQTTRQTIPFASIPGLNGRPLGLVASPDQTSPPAGAALDIAPGLPPRAPFGSSP
ncbi:hypothetical protein ACELLULO517_23135 [Acidisoma cellulosilytica]|uniref:Type II secretion system protein GspC N-terminal domain-containing protein n=1 Tax=Acidisoma cellulosilyticum TaxID=2802395 RepID=A0A963Z5G9_9PROT|nr:hypothetical protein [Acidisoma cellulosilyticum]MCB8883162.1 hypothetical protein [Acidisoma cellulosilyticum]